MAVLPQQTSLVDALATQGALTPAGLDAANCDLRIGCLLDCPHPHAPLLISFGAVEWEQAARFDLWDHSKTFEQLNGRHINRVLLRDIGSLCYQHGCAGMGHSAADLSRALALLVSRLAPSHIITVGQGMGGYAALQFGTELQRRFGHVRMLAFGPLSYLDAERARRDGDSRHAPMMECLAHTRPAGFVTDLVQHMQQAADDGVKLDCHIVMGTAVAPPQGDNYDALHARRFETLPGVRVECIEAAPHAVVQWLIEQGRIDEALAEGIGSLDEAPRPVDVRVDDKGVSLRFESHKARDGSRQVFVCATGFAESPAIESTWQQWIAENLLLGKTKLELLYTLVTRGFDAAQARAVIEDIAASPIMAASSRLSARLAKRDWMLGVTRRNHELDERSHRVPVVAALDRATFLREHYAANRPVVMTGAFDTWPARKQWGFDYLRQTCGQLEVQVQSGRDRNANYETQAQQHRTMMRMADYLDRLQEIDERGERSNDLYITAGNANINEHTLKALWPDTQPALPEYLDSRLVSRNGFFWMGPRGTMTPLHHDLTNNFMAQVMGRKRVWLIAPEYTPLLANHLHCFSEVDLANIDYARFPMMRDVRVLEHVLQPGELLFLPIGWWHQVEGLDTTITMTYTNFLWPNDHARDYTTYGPV